MNKPELSETDAIAYLGGQLKSTPAKLVGIRGFADPADNKRGIYDDAIFLITPHGIFGYNANTDPSVNRTGIAVLQPGTYWYIKGLHGVHHLDQDNPEDKALLERLVSSGRDLPPVPGRTIPYWALRQDSNVMVLRDGAMTTETDSPRNRFWIDIHKGGVNTTSSEGCQTVYPDQWSEFRERVYNEMAFYGQSRIAYILCNKKAG